MRQKSGLINKMCYIPIFHMRSYQILSFEAAKREYPILIIPNLGNMQLHQDNELHLVIVIITKYLVSTATYILVAT